MIYTSYWSTKNIDPAIHIPVRISLGHPRFKLPFVVEGKVPELMPDREWLGLDREDYEPLYLGKLEEVGPTKLREKIEAACLSIMSGPQPPRSPVLLCFEKLTDGTWCHRRMFAEWWQRVTGEEVPEL